VDLKGIFDRQPAFSSEARNPLRPRLQQPLNIRMIYWSRVI
jgi:hypothetical protein